MWNKGESRPVLDSGFAADQTSTYSVRCRVGFSPTLLPMSIEFYCPSGHHLSAPDRKAGRQVRCPVCRQWVLVPESTGASPAIGRVESSGTEVVKARAEIVAGKSEPSAVPPTSAGEKTAAGKESRREKKMPPKLPTSRVAVGQENHPTKPRVAKKLPVPPPLPKNRPKAHPPKPDQQSPEAKERPARSRRLRRIGRREKRATAAEVSSSSNSASEPKRSRRTAAAPRKPKTKYMPHNVYRPDHGKIQTTRWLAFFLTFILLFSAAPALAHLDVETAPGWARAALLLALLQAVYVAWMLATPDWSTVWVVMMVFAVVAALYGMATAVAIATPWDQPMPLGMGQIRTSASRWCGAVLLVMSLATYLCGRTSARWRRTFELEFAGTQKHAGKNRSVG